VRKHKAALATVSLFAALLVVTAVVSISSAIRATDAEATTKRALDVVQEKVEETKAALTAQKEKTELAEQHLYDALVNLVQRYWEDYHGAFFKRALDEQIPVKQRVIDRRGWEWYYWLRKFSSGHITLNGHTDRATSVAFSPDGRRLASVSRDRTVTVRDAATGQEICTFRIRHTMQVTSVSFSPDG
jgi:Anaphase-promoting complex subunit 4 WD40 domain